MTYDISAGHLRDDFEQTAVDELHQFLVDRLPELLADALTGLLDVQQDVLGCEGLPLGHAQPPLQDMPEGHREDVLHDARQPLQHLRVQRSQARLVQL